jgi:uncharacterized protein YcfL
MKKMIFAAIVTASMLAVSCTSKESDNATVPTTVVTDTTVSTTTVTPTESTKTVTPASK